MVQALTGVCHGPVQSDGCAVGEDGAFLFRQTDRSRTHGRRCPVVCRSRAVDCPNRQSLGGPARVLGKWNTVFKRFRDWVKADVFERLFDAVSDEPDMEYAMVDATIHRHGQGAKGGLKAR